MKTSKAYGWLDYVLLDLIKFADLNNLQHTAGKLAEVYDVLQAERETSEKKFGGAQRVWQHVPEKHSLKKWCRTSPTKLIN